MKKNIQFWFDYWLREFLYGPFRTDQYQEWMWQKWGDRYSERYIKDVYDDVNNEK
jgi:hypothetical protein